ncbi:MAG: DUF1488 domain-containing protein [Gammaproteobacteria bacterium]|jgi:hypothetical protein|nr:DUF1488 domain-containing protein [Gammaproteobacteria bacterium]
MYLSRNRPAAAGGAGISFPKLECWNPMDRVAIIAAEVNAKRVLCAISSEVLQQRFRASAEEPMKAVVENRTAIQDAARRLIERKAFEPDGSILIRAGDI